MRYLNILYICMCVCTAAGETVARNLFCGVISRFFPFFSFASLPFLFPSFPFAVKWPLNPASRPDLESAVSPSPSRVQVPWNAFDSCKCQFLLNRIGKLKKFGCFWTYTACCSVVKWLDVLMKWRLIHRPSLWHLAVSADIVCHADISQKFGMACRPTASATMSSPLTHEPMCRSTKITTSIVTCRHPWHMVYTVSGKNNVKMTTWQAM